MDLSTIGGRLQLRLLGAVAQAEVERIRERAAFGKAHRAAKGLVDVAPFGLRQVDGRLEPDWRPFLCLLINKEERSRAALLLEAFASAEKEGSMHAPYKHLGSNYGLWLDRTGMRRLLLNPAFRGARVSGRNKSKATWAHVEEGAGGTPLIDAERHLRFEAMIRGQMARRTTNDKRKKHVLAGKVICGHCGGLMGRGTVTRSPNGRFFCRNQSCGYLIPGKRRNSISEPPLLAGICRMIAERAEEIAEAAEKQAARADERVASQPEIQRLQAKRSTYLKLLADGDPVQPVLDTLDLQIAGLLASGPSGHESHLLELRNGAMRAQIIAGSLDDPDGGSIVTSQPEQVVADFLRSTFSSAAELAAERGEAMLTPELWNRLRDLLLEAVVNERDLHSIKLNLD